MIKEEKRVAARRCALEVPRFSIQKTVILRNDLKRLILRKVNSLCRLEPGFNLPGLQRGFSGECTVCIWFNCAQPVDCLGRVAEVLTSHEVGVCVVVYDGLVFIGPRNGIDAECPSFCAGVEA